ncbi:OmpA family protein [Portibacter marinus]|uniref:OmpA family protein n=1 Tax=Portibacter marinus TaxID=2898660 RepID=UPI001F19CD00|nr:OmpA family protein [Portibacter marinus]
MRYLSVILWILLGFLYYWIWANNAGSCCNADGLTSNQQVLPLDGSALDADSITSGSELEARQSNEAESRARADAEAERAIAEAEETKEVTSVASSDESGITKLTFYFPYGSNNSTYSATTEADLRKLVENAQSSGKKIVVSGHTDSESSAAFNMQLGQRRAERVRSKILSMGISGDQVVAESYGETRPIASNETEEGKQKNRRVEIIIQ